MSTHNFVRLANELRSFSVNTLINDYQRQVREVFNHLGPEAVPVIICARNEATDLPATLISISRSEVAARPIVIDNDSNDQTAEVAMRMGAIVLSHPTPGKMGAFQTGLEFVGAELSGHKTILATDADTIVSAGWAESMKKFTDRCRQYGGIVVGRLRYGHGGSRLVNTARNLVFSTEVGRRKFIANHKRVRGANMAIKLDDEEQIAEGIMSLPPQIFLGDDNALRDIVMRNGGDYMFNDDASGLVITRGDRIQNLREYYLVKRGRIKRRDLYEREYGPGLVSYSPKPARQKELV